MNQAKRKWDRLTDQERKNTIDALVGWYRSQRGEEIGYLASEAILDQVLILISNIIYRKGLEDAQKITDENVENLKAELDALIYENRLEVKV